MSIITIITFFRDNKYLLKYSSVWPYYLLRLPLSYRVFTEMCHRMGNFVIVEDRRSALMGKVMPNWRICWENNCIPSGFWILSNVKVVKAQWCLIVLSYKSYGKTLNFPKNTMLKIICFCNPVASFWHLPNNGPNNGICKFCLFFWKFWCIECHYLKTGNYVI